MDRTIFTHRICASTSALGPSTGHEIFPYWSFTKTVIAICALRMAQEGRIDLDRPLAGYGVSLRQLLGHRSGLADYAALPAYASAVTADEAPWPPAHLRDATLAQGRLFPPGEGWAYSNLGYMLVRHEIEAIAQQPLASLIREMICRPLGLESVGLALTRQDFERLHWKAARRYHPGWVYHGCLTGTAADAAQILHALFSGALLDPAMRAEMLTPCALGGEVARRPWTECGYGLGLMSGRWREVGRVIGHSGGGPFSVNAVYHFPDLPSPMTVASFTSGTDEGIAEYAALQAALREWPPFQR